MTDGSGEVSPSGNLDRLQQLADTLNEVVRQLAQVAETGRQTAEMARRTRRLSIGLVVSYILDIILTTTVTVLTFVALNQGTALHSSQLAACSIGNQTRAEQIALWTYVFQVSGPPKTPAEEQLRQKFLAHVNATFAPVNCNAVYK